MPYLAFKGGGRRVRRPGCRHCEILDAFEAADVAWHERRESGETVHGRVAGGAHADIAYYQLSDEEYRAMHPRPRLKEFLLSMGGMHRDDEEQSDDYEEFDDSNIDYSSF